MLIGFVPDFLFIKAMGLPMKNGGMSFDFILIDKTDRKW